MCSHLAFATPASLPTALVSHLSPLATSRPRLLHSRPRTSVRISPVAGQTPSSPTTRSPPISNPLKPLVTPATPAVSFTHYSGNSFCLEYTSPTLSRPLRILVDPWLQGDLVFGEGLLGPSFFSAKKPLAQENDISAFGTFDAIVLSQDLPDHAHPPTLAALPRDLPVICPESAVALLKDLNYTSIHSVKPRGGRKSFATGTSLDIFSLRTGPGAITGPPWSTPQLAFCFQFREGAGEGVRIYFETHGEHDLDFVRELMAGGEKLDAVISPVIETTLPVLGNYRIVSGIPEVIELCEVARPRACVPFDNSGTPSSGAFSKLVKQKGSQEELREKMAATEGLREIVITEPEVMEKIFVAVKDMS